MKRRINEETRTIARLLLLAFISLCAGCTSPKEKPAETSVMLDDKYKGIIQTVFPEMARLHNADSRFLLIVDYSIPSNNARFFLWDNEQDKIIERFWCAHGFGGNSTAEKPEFSNVIGSNCSSLGWFVVDRSVGVSANYGYRYHAVDGLEDCNSNARRRQLLIHPWSSVSYDEMEQIQQPMELDYRSAGCFTTSEIGFQTIDQYIKSRTKPLLLFATDGI